MALDLNLIADRTAEDVSAGRAKGFYRHTDLNRVQAAVQYLRERYGAAGYDTVPAPVFRTWQENDVPRYADLDGYLRGVLSLEGLVPLQSAPALPWSPDRLDWRGANAIEAFLGQMDETMDRIAEAWAFCGEVFAGEVDE